MNPSEPFVDNRRGLKIAAICTALAVGGISLMASTGVGAGILDTVKSLPGGDTSAHFLLIGSMAFVVTLAFVSHDPKRRLRQWLLVVGTLVALVSVDEFSQLLLPRRTFSLSDLIANYAGIVVFSAAALWLRVLGKRD
jgi:hypothetical protein